ncbi:hypothetical protein WJX73_008827 [Symbiochloris irregularis]|uniref:S-adenosyl-L-methionine-dependent methyltransferase n=1 Tax=Symbiochloris irregularis TaxID=706552 RepID=A0AAW1P433_9CHLO
MASTPTLNTEEGRVVDDELSKFVSYTARLVAVLRALETEEPDAVLKDPLADVFAGPQALDYGRTLLREHPERSTQIIMGLPPAALGRKRRIGGGVVVMLGAGLDARPWRLPLPEGVRWYEIDHAEIHRVKHKALQANEGLLGYLSTDAVRKLLTEASQACKPGSVLTADILTDEAIAEHSEKHMLKNIREHFKRGWGAPMPIEKFEAFMGECGWKVVKIIGDLIDAAPIVVPGSEYNMPPRPEGRKYQYMLGIYVSVPLVPHTSSQRSAAS